MKSLRLRDEIRPERPVPLEPEALAGTWINTAGTTDGLVRLDVDALGGELVVRSRGPRSDGPIYWGKAVVYAGIASPAPLAFTAHRDFGSYRGLLQGNLNLGLLVLGTYKTYPGGRSGYFSREFFALEPTPEHAAASGTHTEALFAGAREPDTVDFQPMLGRWRNADAGTRGIAEIRIAARDGRPVVHVLGTGVAGLADWGEAEVGLYACVDETGARTLSLLGRYDFGFMESQLQLRLPGGTLALADFTVFKDESGRPSTCTREFFFRD